MLIDIPCVMRSAWVIESLSRLATSGWLAYFPAY